MEAASKRIERRLAAIFAADVAGYSRLMEADEVGTMRSLVAHREVMDRLIAERGGRIANTAGDSVLAEFPSAVEAVQCAVDVQQRLASGPSSPKLQFRIGVHVGDVMVRGDDLLGDGVNIAARLQAIAEPGGICLSGAAYDYVRKTLPLAFKELGPQKVKNIEEPVRAYALEAFAPISSMSPLHPSLPDKPSIAVLPFTNMSGDPEQEYFTDGITEDIITEISRISAFFVIARNTTFTLKGKAVDVKQVGRELGVQYIVEGSARRSGGRVRVTAQLIDALTGNHIWADRYDRELADLFSVQDEITRSIVSSTQTQVVLNEGVVAERGQWLSFRTWDMAKRGWRDIYLLTRESIEEARRIGLAIIEHDPSSPKGHQLVAAANYHLVWMGFSSDPTPLREEALRQIQEAIRLDERDEYSQWIYGSVVGIVLGRHDEGIAAYEQALEINPNFSLAYASLGTVLSLAGRADESISNVEYAIRLNPRDPSLFFGYSTLALAYFSKSDYQKAKEWAQRAIARRSSWWLSYTVLAASHIHLQDMNSAKAALSGLLDVLPGRSITTLPLPQMHPDQLERLLEGLRLAGLPD